MKKTIPIWNVSIDSDTIGNVAGFLHFEEMLQTNLSWFMLKNIYPYYKWSIAW